jgi:hypothetical protein
MRSRPRCSGRRLASIASCTVFASPPAAGPRSPRPARLVAAERGGVISRATVASSTRVIRLATIDRYRTGRVARNMNMCCAPPPETDDGTAAHEVPRADDTDVAGHGHAHVAVE